MCALAREDAGIDRFRNARFTGPGTGVTPTVIQS